MAVSAGDRTVERVQEILTALLAIYVELGDRVAAARTRSRLDRSSTLTMARP